MREYWRQTNMGKLDKESLLHELVTTMTSMLHPDFINNSEEAYHEIY